MMKRFALLSLTVLLGACAGGYQASYNPQATGLAKPSAAAPNAMPNQPETTGVLPGTPPAPGGQPAKIALLLPLSGPHAALGQAMLQAAQLALFDVGSNSFQLLPRDTGDTADGAAQAAEAAVHDGAQLVLGPIFASSVRAAAPVVARAGINMIAFSTDVTLAGGNTYLLGFVPAGEVKRVIQYSAGQGLHKIGVLAAAGDYGDAVLTAYEKEAPRAGIETVTTARLPANPAQLSSAVTVFAHSGGKPLDAVLIAADGPQAQAAAAQLEQNGLGPDKVRRLGTGLWDDLGLASAQDLKNAWFAGSPPEQRQGFEHRYGDTYGQAAPRLATLAYDATALAAVLAKKGGAQRQAFDRAALTNPNGFAGVDGVFRFQTDNIAERGLGVLTFRDGKIAVQDAAPQTFQKALTQ